MGTSGRKVSVLGVPYDKGAGSRGAALGPQAMLHAGLLRQIRQLGIEAEDRGMLSVPSMEKGEPSNGRLKHLQACAEVNTALADEVSDIVSQGRFPLVLGGDHSLAIGTIAGLAAHYKNLGLLWMDAHSDLNTAATSPSGNIHGMSLAVSLGSGHPLLTGIREARPKVKPEHVAIIGARQLDPGEKELIRKQGIRCFTMHDIDRLGMPRVMEQAMEIVTQGTDGVHLSFDIDSLDPREAPGTGTKVSGGLSYREAHFAMELLSEAGILTSAEFVEVNPSLDSGNRTARLAVELIGSMLGKRIL